MTLRVGEFVVVPCNVKGYVGYVRMFPSPRLDRLENGLNSLNHDNHVFCRGMVLAVVPVSTQHDREACYLLDSATFKVGWVPMSWAQEWL